jgi:DNA-binding MurR/RpiR family transcriptional regulator
VSIQELIANAGERLTPTDRRIAEAVLGDPTLLAFGTVSDLADRADTSRPSIVRFATKLGFEGYTDLQGWIREGVTRQLSSPSQRIRRLDTNGAPIQSALTDAVDRALDSLTTERLATLARPIVDAERVWIISGETSMSGAHALHSGLAMVRPDVHMVQAQSTGRDITGAGPSDCAVVIDFPRYRRTSITAARTLADLGVTLVAITDGALSPLASLTPTWCALQVPAVGPFDSSVPVVLASELIVAKAVALLGDRARERIDRLEGMWQATETFVAE